MRLQFSPRWQKLLGDLRSTQGRTAMMVIALAVGIFGVGTILNAYAILTREISRNYLGTNPASAIFELDRVDDALLRAVRQRPEIAAAESSATVLSRLEVKPGEWIPILLFVIRDFKELSINSFTPVSGAWPPARGTVLLEREALRFIHAKTGDALRVQTPNGTKRRITISGVVHDPGLAPAWQEQMAYGYATPDTLEWLGESREPNLLKIVVRQEPLNPLAIDRTVSNLARWLKSAGHKVEEIRVPPPGKHPHQTQMTAILTMLLIFSGLALALSAILTATMIGGLLAQQVRQIGVMKAIGARTWQIANLYLALVAVMGFVAVAVGVPAGIAVGRGFARVVAELLNFRLYSEAIPTWIFVVQFAVGMLVPLLVALVPILGATRITVREAMVDVGVSGRNFGKDWLEEALGKLRGLDRTLVLAIRNTFRRRGRLLLTLGLLASAGAMFMTSLNVKAAWEQYLSAAARERHYDLEVRLNQAQPEVSTFGLIAAVPGVNHVETWNITPAAASRSDGLDIVRTYPDGGHGSFTLRSAPVSSTLVTHSLMSGRWLEAGDVKAVVLNHNAAALFPNVRPGETVSLNLDGRNAAFRVVGIARERITPAAAYTTPQGYARALREAGLTNAVRIVMNDHQPSAIDRVTQQIERVLEKSGISVKVNISETRLDGALSGHVYILIYALVMMAVVMAVVGALGLMSTMSTNVTERTREFGIMRTIGGQSATVLRNVVSEGVFIGLMSWVIALVLSLPLSAAIGNLIGTLAFRSPLELLLSPLAVLIWWLVIVIGAIAASAYPAWRASTLTIRETLAYN